MMIPSTKRTMRWNVEFHCADCAEKLQDLVTAFNSVSARLELPDDAQEATLFRGFIVIDYDERLVDDSDILDAATDEGFQVLSVEEL